MGSAKAEVASPRAARFSMRFTRGVDEYEVELSQLPSPGVALDTVAFGSTGIGPPMTEAGAAFVLRGTGTVSKGGEVVARRVAIEVMALSAGFHADDSTFTALRGARPGDAELLVFATGLPLAVDPRGFWVFGFDDVDITLRGRHLPNVPFIPSEAPSVTYGAPSPYGAGYSVMTGYGSTTPLPPGSSVSTSTTSAAQPIVLSPQAGGPTTVVPGIPASPPVANNGSVVLSAPPGPAPLNESGAPGPIQGISPANAQPASPLPGSVPANPGR
jgi:hypothetical protein